MELVSDVATKVSHSLESISAEIQNLAGRTEQVDEILQVTNSIASETNLLSMNAACFFSYRIRIFSP